MKLSDCILKFVADLGVKDLFLVTGGDAMHLNQSLATETRIRDICNSHEQVSTIYAEGYLEGDQPSGCMHGHHRPNRTNAVVSVAGAWLDSTQVIYISGQVKRPTV